MVPEPPGTAPPGAIPEPRHWSAAGELTVPGPTPPPDVPPPDGSLTTDAKPRGRRIGRTVAIMVLVVVLLGVIGSVLRVVREASASPKDKAACAATASMIESEGATLDSAMQSWSAADDGGIRGEIENVRAAIVAQDASKLAESVNRVIARCNKISRDFRNRFDAFCKAHEGACKRNFRL